MRFPEEGKYVYLGGSVIRELNATDRVVKEYVRGPDLGGGIGGILYQKKSSDYYYYHYNHKGDVVALTEADQDLAAYYEYDAWGNTMTEAEVSGVDNPYRYSTKEWDERSSLYYFGARYYSPEVGRWTQRDPAGTVDGLNLYAYVNNDPAGRIDPEGRWGIPWPVIEGLRQLSRCYKVCCKVQPLNIKVAYHRKIEKRGGPLGLFGWTKRWDDILEEEIKPVVRREVRRAATKEWGDCSSVDNTWELILDMRLPMKRLQRIDERDNGDVFRAVIRITFDLWARCWGKRTGGL